MQASKDLGWCAGAGCGWVREQERKSKRRARRLTTSEYVVSSYWTTDNKKALTKYNWWTELCCACHLSVSESIASAGHTWDFRGKPAYGYVAPPEWLSAVCQSVRPQSLFVSLSVTYWNVILQESSQSVCLFVCLLRSKQIDFAKFRQLLFLFFSDWLTRQTDRQTDRRTDSFLAGWFLAIWWK